MDSSGRLHFTDGKGDGFVGMTYAETGVVDEAGCLKTSEYSEAPANRKARRAQAAYERTAEYRAERARLDEMLKSFEPVPAVR